MQKLAIVLGSFLMIASVTVVAQGRGGNPEDRLEEQLNHLKIMLDLTDEQYTSIEEVMKKQQSEMKALREEAGKERDVMRDKAKIIQTSAKNNIKSILSEEQQVKFEELSKKNKERNRKGKSDRGGKGNSKSNQNE